MLYIWLLLNCVSLVVSQHVSLNRTDRDFKCLNSDLHRIKKYFRETTVVRNEDSTAIHYCIKKQYSKDSSFDIQYLDQVIDLYKSFEYVNSYKYIDPDGSMIFDGFLSINDYQVLPLYQIADIRKKTLPCVNTYPGFGNDVNVQMYLMGLNSTDEQGYLLGHSLGGSSKAINVVPMAINLYEHLPLLIGPHEGLQMPSSNWRSNELWVREFLLRYYPNGRVLWKSAVQYEENIFSFPRQYQSYRPLSFSLQYVAYTNENDETSAYYRSPEITFLNSNDYPCDTGVPCHGDEVDNNIEDSKSCDIENFPITITPKGKLGSELKPPTYSAWGRNYILTIPFYMAPGKTYIYQQGPLENQKYTWVISEITKDAKMIEIQKGNHTQNRDIAFTYFMNGTQYLYTYSSSEKKWFINELSPNMSEQVTDQGTWPEKIHYKAVPFTIDGKYYFFSQFQGTTNSYFIKKLDPYGQLKKNAEATVETGPWEDRPIVFTYILNNKHYIYAHKPANATYTIHELLPEGKIGKEVDNGYVGFGCDDSFTYTLKEKQFIYGIRRKPFAMFIKEVLPNGKIDKKSTYSSNDTNVAHDSAVPILLDGAQYVLTQKEKAWKIFELL